MWKTAGLSLLVFAVATPAWVHAEPPGEEPPSGLTAEEPAPDQPAPPAVPSKTELIDPFAEPSTPTEQPAAKPKAETTLTFRNDAGSAFALSEAHFVMDGQALPTVIANPQRGKSYVVYSGPVTAGRHVVTVHMVYQGRNRGAFNYMKGYKLNVSSDGVFTMPENRNVGFTIVSKEKNGLNVSLDKRIAVGVEETPRR